MSKRRIMGIGTIIIVIICVICITMIIFKRNNRQDDVCVVTQYADVTGKQADCYTITKNGKLIIIDGGWADNAPALRQIIADHGNHVDAWFISHTHSDHVGAFNVIYADPQGITIDKIYDNGCDYNFIMEVGEPYDGEGVEPARTFYNLTKDVDCIVHLKRNDVFEICGLKFQVFNAFDDIVKQNVGEELDYQNNGSLCMKITNKKESFLYTGDIKYDMNTYLSDTYGDALSSDYVQLSHHGNWGLNVEYYDLMNAKVYFSDITPDFYNESFPIYELRQHLLDEGKTYYDLGTAPNAIELN